MNVKQVIVIRKDLNMRKGKMIAQGAHASMKVFFDIMEDYETSGGMQSLITYKRFFPTMAMREWIKGEFTKIVVSVDSEEELLKLHQNALNKKIPCSLIKDAGHTEFKEPTYTAVAIGPDESEKIDKLTGHLKLL